MHLNTQEETVQEQLSYWTQSKDQLKTPKFNGYI
jgi:hypothetical protein